MTNHSAPAAALVVAIDGPSGSGKSSVSRAVARQLGAAYLDTGAMYRAVAWGCLRDGVDLGDEPAVERYAASLPLRMGTDPDAPGVWVGDTDIGQAIREDRVTGVVSAVATNLGVRAELRRRQRELIDAGARERGAVVAEGRDITTVVAPDADVRILLTANEQARVARRASENLGRADADALASTRGQVIDRDRLDGTVASFQEAADGVVTVDTSDLDLPGAVAAVLAVVRSMTAGRHSEKAGTDG